MRHALILFFTLTWACTLLATPTIKTYSNENYQDTLASDAFLTFEYTSSALALFSTNIKGVTKKFQLTYDLHEDIMSNAVVSFLVTDLDTNDQERDEKMRSESFSSKTFPEVHIKFPNALPVNRKKFLNEPAIMYVRGKNKNIKVDLEFFEKDSIKWVQGSSTINLNELEIPQPDRTFSSIKPEIIINFALPY